MGLVGLGAKLVATVNSPAQCPSGTWHETATVAVPGAGYVQQKTYCYKGEPWYCEWFGWGCKGVIPVQPPSPRTRDQMERPSQWTPEQVASEWKEQERQNIKEWAEATRGIDLVDVGLYKAGKAIGDVAGAVGDAAKETLIYTGIGLAIALGVAVFLVVKTR
jgi:hypothetical protein